MTDLSIEYLRECFDADFETGKMIWKARPVSHFKDGLKRSAQSVANRWNSRYAGKSAGSLSWKGYLRVSVDDTRYSAHRVIYAMANNGWPKGQIDHINGDRTDNRIANLRDVSHAENLKNKHRKKQGVSSKFVGVCWDKIRGKWRANIRIDGAQTHLGSFTSELDAAAAYRVAAEANGFTEAHIRASDGTLPPLPANRKPEAA